MLLYEAGEEEMTQCCDDGSLGPRRVPVATHQPAVHNVVERKLYDDQGYYLGGQIWESSQTSNGDATAKFAAKIQEIPGGESGQERIDIGSADAWRGSFAGRVHPGA